MGMEKDASQERTGHVNAYELKRKATGYIIKLKALTEP